MVTRTAPSECVCRDLRRIWLAAMLAAIRKPKPRIVAPRLPRG